MKKEYYWDNGNLRFRGNFKNGEYHGLCEDWWNDGTLRSRYNYKNGKYHGLCEYWSNGTPWSKEYYFNDKQVTEFEFDVLKTCGEFENE